MDTTKAKYMKNRRVMVTPNGRFVPQWRSCFFGMWRFFSPRAVRTDLLFVWAIEERDPAKAAIFDTEEEAQTFLRAVNANVQRLHAERNGAMARARQGEGYFGARTQ